MPELRRHSTSEDFTAALARSVAFLLRPGDLITLDGPMGAGKTTFVRSLAAGIGIQPGLVSSPTFVLVNVYPIQPNAPVVPANLSAQTLRTLIHVDAFRVSDIEELSNAGWDELFDANSRRPRGSAAAIIEWPDRLPGCLPDSNILRIRIEPAGLTDRTFTIHIPDSWHTREGLDAFIAHEPTKCAITGLWVPPTATTYPFANERAKLADLNRWFTESYTTSRPITPEDHEA